MPKKTFDEASWQAKLAQARVPKEDMNRLIMNFLVTEVCKPRQVWICRWKQTCCVRARPNCHVCKQCLACCSWDLHKWQPSGHVLVVRGSCRRGMLRQRASSRANLAHRPASTWTQSQTACRYGKRCRVVTWSKQWSASTTSTPRRVLPHACRRRCMPGA